MTFSATPAKIPRRSFRLYGRERGERFKHAEALEIGEYGAPVDAKNLHALFPFFK